MERQELVDAFSFEGINRANAVVNFKEDDPIDPKALWLNAEQIRALPIEELADRLLPFVAAAGFGADLEKLVHIAPLIRERIKLLSDIAAVADFFFVDELPPYDPAELVPQKGDPTLALAVLQHACRVLSEVPFEHDSLENALRKASEAMGIKTGQMFQPVRVAVCGRKNAPPLFATLEVLGRETCLKRIGQAIQMLAETR
jgi:glutamyl-tRNA synthetase